MNCPSKLHGWTEHARNEFADILGQSPSNQQMRALLRLWQKHNQQAFLNRQGRWQVKVVYKHKQQSHNLWLVAGKQNGKWLLWTVFEVE